MHTLVLFARIPRPGRVKTRLSPALPAPLAALLHRAMVEDAAELLSEARADRRVLYWDDEPGDAGPRVPPAVEQRLQSGSGLGDRLEAAFAEVVAPGTHAVVFGTDCPALGPAELEALFAALEASDLAVIPAMDGGYVALGLRRPAPAVFRGIEWSTAAVLEQTLARAEHEGLTTRVLAPALGDLDTPADLLRHLAAPGARAAALDRALRVMGLLPPA